MGNWTVRADFEVQAASADEAIQKIADRVRGEDVKGVGPIVDLAAREGARLLDRLPASSTQPK